MNTTTNHSVALKKIEDTYTNDTGKKFIHHLIAAFLDPMLVVVPAAIQDAEPMCAITGKKLVSQVGMLELVSDADMKKTVSCITRIGFEESQNGTDAGVTTQIQQLIETEFDGYEPLITSINSTKYLGLTGYQMLQKFVQMQMAANNEHIINMINFINKKNIGKHGNK